jgi:hypothetical protein
VGIWNNAVNHDDAVELHWMGMSGWGNDDTMGRKVGLKILFFLNFVEKNDKVGKKSSTWPFFC